MNNPKEEGAASIPPRYRLSCTECFDALWFCYSPVHQMQQYYRHGVPDSCSEKWSALFDCFNLKTKRSSEVQEILEARERSKTHIWSYRSVDEASSHWKELFGHINDEE
ncbi:hypothetical protein MRB53_018138 [Persea americana]|uniref:Uncharacterized protein n=1 Tax=Persea americana TaxID=3435 RepID=A0ACC2M7Z6_PERAE|nr:hypothetical protein MRB53_018138 [Persea americana]|eukprot:TRINITY_DN915_c0_g1_i2.p1 TRINITY_DN915_c0_g1~~TRINITY_DN915_c0_g1_i2.p1  ORF type:complete len:109 (+),score=23.78 TRINITY_DN915_c0_g1_i2:143-469(+)